jgi:hypothetical protein
LAFEVTVKPSTSVIESAWLGAPPSQADGRGQRGGGG